MFYRHQTILFFSFFMVIALPSEVLSENLHTVVEVEEVVTSFEYAGSGSGPTWGGGLPIIIRQDDDVYITVTSGNKDIPPLCNAQWQIWHRRDDGWKLVQHEDGFRQREPCPLAVFDKGQFFLSVNPSLEPPGVHYGRCKPLVLEFDPADWTSRPKVHKPAWADGTYFTDHSYRGFCADGANGELFLININAETAEQFATYRDSKGKWHEKGKIKYPMRNCYPQVFLRNGSAHVFSVSDIREPNKKWAEVKGRTNWVFRNVFYTYTPDIKTQGFIRPVRIDSVDDTAGSMFPLDLYVDDSNAVHLLYIKGHYRDSKIHREFFPDKKPSTSIEYATVNDGKITSRLTLIKKINYSHGDIYGRFHVRGNGQLYVITTMIKDKPTDNESRGLYIAQIYPGIDKPEFIPIKTKYPFGKFFTSTIRGGSKPSNIIDIMFTHGRKIRYARIRLTEN